MSITIIATVQIKEANKEWDAITKVPHSFKDDKEINSFANRLAIHHNAEVRVERNGNGYYYRPEAAYNYFGYINPALYPAYMSTDPNDFVEI